jgi:hypothetical protein
MEDDAGRKGYEEDAEGGKDPILPNVGTVTSPASARERGGSRFKGNDLELMVSDLATMIQGTSNWIQESPEGSDREA